MGVHIGVVGRELARAARQAAVARGAQGGVVAQVADEVADVGGLQLAARVLRGDARQGAPAEVPAAGQAVDVVIVEQRQFGAGGRDVVAGLDADERRRAVGALDEGRRIDGQVLGRLEANQQSAGPGGFVVDVLQAEIGVVHVAFGFAVEQDRARGQLVLDQRHVDHGVGLVAHAAFVGGEDVALDRTFIFVDGLLEDHAHRAGHGAGAVQRALRAAQHFDLLDVEHLQVGRTGAAVAGGAGRTADRDFVVIDADLGLAGALDAADHDAPCAGAAVDQGQAGHGLGVVADVVDAHLGQGLAGDGGNGDRRVLKNGRALQRRDDEFFNLRTARGGPLSPGGPAACDQQG